MNEEIINPKTRQVFREAMVEWTLRQISDEFDAARVACDLNHSPSVTGERRSLVERYYCTVNWIEWEHVKQVIQVYEEVLLRLEQKISECETDWEKKSKAELDKLIWCLNKDGFDWVAGRIVLGAGIFHLNEMKKTADIFDAKHMMEQIRRMESAVESDPSLAIGTAKELIETCCKTILADRGKTVSGTPDIPTLTKETLKELRLVPDGIPDAARGSDVIKRLLSNLGTIGNGLAELRGLYGSGHGKHGKSAGLGPRHAKLAVGAAATLAIFLFETHEETKS